MKTILKEFENKIFVLDGAMGTMLHLAGFTKGCPDELNLTHPDVIFNIHNAYKNAGSDMVLTNTFGANRTKLKKYNLENSLCEINEKAVEIARKTGCIVVGDVGPLDEFLEPLGKITFDEAYEIFKEQILALSKADMLIIETQSDIKTVKAAVIAAKEVFSGPIITSMTIQDGRTTTGTDIETYVTICDALNVDIIGVNCSDGPEGMLETLKIISKNTNKPICVQPNAGLPKLVAGKTVWDYPKENFRNYAKKFAENGANIVGGCCGTNPEFIKEISNAVKTLKPIKKDNPIKTKLSSRTKTIEISPTLIVGERINPTNRKIFLQELKDGKTNYIKNQALQQVLEGASLLDVNVGAAGTDEKLNLKKAVETVQNVVNCPIVIDTSNKFALEEALKASDGKPLINSVNGSEKSLNEVIPLAKKYGAAIIALCLDDSGIPTTTNDRVNMAKKISDYAIKHGIKKEDIIVDSLVMTLATNAENEKIVLESVKEIKHLGFKTILGVSNISHGLPNRQEINAKFLTNAKKAGLDLAILNPIDNISMQDSNIRIENTIEKIDYSNMPLDKQLYNSILYGDKENISDLVKTALKSFKALEINDILIDALNEVGRRFNAKEFFLPQVLLSAAAMKNAFLILKSEMKKEGSESKGKIMFATVENDIHDIGKNIVIALLESHNFEVIDLGANVKTEKIISEVKKYNPDILALSALMTTTVQEMENVVSLLKKENITIPVIIGGAVVTGDYASEINTAYAKDALLAVKTISELLKKIKK